MAPEMVPETEAAAAATPRRGAGKDEDRDSGREGGPGSLAASARGILSAALGKKGRRDSDEIQRTMVQKGAEKEEKRMNVFTFV